MLRKTALQTLQHGVKLCAEEVHISRDIIPVTEVHGKSEGLEQTSGISWRPHSAKGLLRHCYEVVTDDLNVKSLLHRPPYLHIEGLVPPCLAPSDYY